MQVIHHTFGRYLAKYLAVRPVSVTVIIRSAARSFAVRTA
jgi:hypothetical protein